MFFRDVTVVRSHPLVLAVTTNRSNRRIGHRRGKMNEIRLSSGVC